MVDAGVLYAATNTADQDHARCRDSLRRTDLRLVVPALVMAETAHLLETRLGARVEAEFLRRVSRMDIECPEPEDWPSIADLVEQYGDFPLGTTDASVAVLAERLDTDLIITLDRRHFGAIRMPSGRTFTILPD